jgi:hypothetical protein
VVNHPITRFLVKLRVFRGELPDRLGEGMRWHAISHLDELPMPSPHRRVVQKVLERSETEAPSAAEDEVGKVRLLCPSCLIPSSSPVSYEDAHRSQTQSDA